MNPAETALLWTQRLKRFEQSQMTVAQFCQDEGVSQPTFYKWKRRMQSPARQSPLAAAKFVPVSLAPPSRQNNTTTDCVKATIQLPHGIRIFIEVPAESEHHSNAQAES